MKKVAKYSIALFGLGSSLAVFFPACSGSACAAFIDSDKVSALIAQLQGRCCIYKAAPYGSCEKMAEPYMPIPWHNYSCASWAARCLGEMGKTAKQAVPALIQALETGPNNYNTGDGPIPTRDSITLALGQIGDPKAVKPLIAAIYSQRPTDASWTAGRRSKKPRKPYAAIAALGLMGPVAREAVPHIIPFLKEKDPYLFRHAAKALGQIKDPRAIPALIEALNRPIGAGLAASALGEFGSLADEATPILIEMLKKSPDTFDSLSIASAIGKLRGEAAVPRITYWHKKADLMKELLAIFSAYKLRGEFTASDVHGEEYSQTLPTGEKLYVRLDRSMSNSSLNSGQVWIERDSEKISLQRFSTFMEMREILKKELDVRLNPASPSGKQY